MDVSNALRQVEEVLTLQDRWFNDAIEIQTPALFDRLKRVRPSAKGNLEVKKCLSIHISCAILHPDELPDLILAFEFPFDYPNRATCRVRALSAKAMAKAKAKASKSMDMDINATSLEYNSCTDQLQKYLESFCGCECVEFALDWIAQNKDTCLNESSPSSSNDMEGKAQCYVLRYNHLLSGPEHKKEKSMLDAAKKARLQGGLLWGTPGVVVVVPPCTEEDAKEYGSDCRTIGKRPDGVEEIWLPEVGIDEAGLGGLAQQKRGGKLQELDTSGLRIACGSDEDLLRSVLGIK